ncbi:MAG: TetR/AcrR family transcriptional regulator [Solirubrobacteraceae bacterium]
MLAAALDQFVDMGFAATTIEDIRAHSGASNGSIYHHFASKEQIAGTLYLEALLGYQRGFLEVLERARSAEAGIKDGVRYHLRWVAENPKLASFLLYRRETEVRRVTQAAVRAANRQTFSAVASWLAPRVEAGAIRRLPADVYYAAWLGAAQEFVRLWHSGALKTPIDEATEALADAAWRSLGQASSERSGASTDRR